MGERGQAVRTPSLRFGIMEVLGLVLGQDCDRAVQVIGSVLE